MKRRNHFVIVLSIVLCLFTGCGASSIRAEPYLADLERVLALKDQMSQSYLQALSASLAYAKDPSPETLAKAKGVCVSSIDTITNIETVESALTDEQRQTMSELGMDRADYMAPFIMQSYEQGTRLETLIEVLHYLNNAPASDDVLSLVAELNITFEELEWQIDLIGVNHLLAEVPEAELHEFKNTYLPSLTAFAGKPISWGDDRAALEEQSEEVFMQMESLVGANAEKIGAMYNSILEETRDPAAELEAAGLSSDESTRLEEKMTPILEKSQGSLG